MAWDTSGKVNTGLGLAAIAFLVVGLLTLWSVNHLIADAERVAHTHETLAELEDVFSVMKDVETGGRGFIITGDDQFLESFDATVAAAERQFLKLKDLTADNRAQQERLDALKPLMDRRIEIMRDLIALRTERGLAAAADALKAGQGKRIMDEIRGQIRVLQQTETDLLEQREEAKKRTARRTTQTVLLGSALALVCLLASSYILRRDLNLRHAAEAALRESEERQRLIVEYANDAFVGMNAAGHIEDWNSQAEALFGWRHQEVLGKLVAEVIIPERMRQAHQVGLQTFLETGEGPVINRRVEVTALHRDGREIPVELTISPVRWKGGWLFGAFVHDIAPRKAAETALIQAKEAAEAANQAKSGFLAGMSHELRTPLNSVIGFSNILLKNKAGNLGEQDQMYLNRILENGEHLLGLINTILDLAKVEAGRMELEIVPLDLEKLVSETVAQLEGRALDRDIRILTDVPPVLAPLEADADKLKQVLINLLGNALKFTEGGSVMVRVVAQGSPPVPVRLDVIDTGIGIRAEKPQTIFEAFQQADEGTSRQYGGTGLGLTIPRVLCERMGFRLVACSEPGAGSTFSVLLTSEAEPPDRHREFGDCGKALARNAAPPDSDVHHAAKGKLVLVIDDEPDARLVLSQYLQDFGCRVVTAHGGVEGIRQARECRPDLITLDLMMPQVNGWEVLKLLKGNPDLAGIPVVIVSIVARENKSFLLGAVDILDKPIQREQLAKALARVGCPYVTKVLLVDDDADGRKLLEACLGEVAREVRSAGNGQEALQMLESFVPDLIVLDLVMPVMDGPTFLERLRRDARFANLPVIVVTALDLARAEVRCLREQVTAVLSKDCVEESLRRVLSSLPDKGSPSLPIGSP